MMDRCFADSAENAVRALHPSSKVKDLKKLDSCEIPGKRLKDFYQGTLRKLKMECREIGKLH